MRDSPIADQPPLRAALRAHTAGLHEALDQRVGAFASVAEYRDFVLRSYRFRQVAEAAFSDSTLWQGHSLLSSIRQDMADLSIVPEPGDSEPLELSGPSAMIGGLYVLEGSAIGARLLLRRAAALGFSETFGARHLGMQGGEPARWKAFVHVLDTAIIDRHAALSGAQRVFERALAIYSEELHEQA